MSCNHNRYQRPGCIPPQPFNIIAQAVRDALADRMVELQGYSTSAAASALSASGSAAEAKQYSLDALGYRDQTQIIFNNAQALVPEILETSANLHETAEIVQAIAQTASSFQIVKYPYTIIGGEETIIIPNQYKVLAVQSMIVEGSTLNAATGDFVYDTSTRTITLAQPFPDDAAGIVIIINLGQRNVESPETALSVLASPSGSGMIGTPSGSTVQQALDIFAKGQSDQNTEIEGVKTDKVSKTTLASTSGASMVGMPIGGTVQDMLPFVRPWQFGAIADGTPHPLSERYSSLDAAKAVYPFVTALTQTIDWAACQAADNYARANGLTVRCLNPLGSSKSVFHFGDSDYLELGISSKWYGTTNVNRDTASITFIRTKPATKPAWGQDCVVRVMDAKKAGSPDEFVRGIVFEGFILSRGSGRRAASKGDGSFCFHANYGMGMSLGLVAFGAEFGVFGYSFWASTGWLKIDTCHKGFFADASLISPEQATAPSGSVNTTFNFDVRIDACVFGLVLKRVKYSSFRGYIEGMAVGTTSVPFPIYDSANETAIAVTAIYCDSVDIEQLGIEYWEGSILYSLGSSISMNVSLTQDKQIKNSTGKQSAWKTVCDLNGTADLHPLPSSANSVFYSMGTGTVTIRNLTGDYSNATTFSDVYFLTKESGAAIVFENCAFYMGANTARFCNGSMARIEVIGGRYLEDTITPSGYTKIGKNLFVRSSWQSKAISAGDGRVAITVGSDTPSGLKIHTVEAKPYAAAQSGIPAIAIFSADDNSVAFQTSVTATGATIRYKDTVSWTY